MPRFYVPADLCQLSIFSLPSSIARHVQVLRNPPGEIIELFDGKGMIYQAEIMAMGKKNVDVAVKKKDYLSVESKLVLHLWQSVSSSEHMDFTIQKAVELGVSTIQPILTERSSQRLSGERAEKKLMRWREIAISACEQSGRTFIPDIYPIQLFTPALFAQLSSELKILMSLNQPKALNQLMTPKSVTLLVGPEGGFNEAEENLAISQGFQAISLGPRVLRTETASLAALSAMQALWGDFRVD